MKRTQPGSLSSLSEVDLDEHVPLIAMCLAGLVAWALLFARFGAEDSYHAVAAIAILLGGSWTFYQFVLKRSSESALSIDYSVATQPVFPGAPDFVTFVEITLTNTGNRKLTASGDSVMDLMNSYQGTIAYPGDLQVRALPLGAAPAFIDWWSGAQNIPPLPEHISLLNDYDDETEQVEFFMEPGERYDLGRTFILPRGHYLVKAVFVGSRPTEYWSRIIYFSVPAN